MRIKIMNPEILYPTLFEPVNEMPVEMSVYTAQIHLKFRHGNLTVDCETVQQLRQYMEFIPTIPAILIDGEFNAGWPTIQTALSKCTQLTKLYIKRRGGDGPNMPELLSKNTKLRDLTLRQVHYSRDEWDVICEAIIEHPSLKRLACTEAHFGPDILSRLIRENRILRQIETDIDEKKDVEHQSELAAAIALNWVIRRISSRGCANALDGGWCRIRWSPPWQFIHQELGKLAITLLPLRLPIYELLWILGWIRPMSVRYNWRGDPEYDPYLGKKFALISSMAHSYRAVKG